MIIFGGGAASIFLPDVHLYYIHTTSNIDEINLLGKKLKICHDTWVYYGDLQPNKNRCRTCINGSCYQKESKQSLVGTY